MVHWLKRTHDKVRFQHAASLGWKTALVAGLTAGALLLMPGSALAQTDSPCPFSGVLCLFEGTDYTGAVWNVRAITPGVGVCVNLGEHGWEDRAYSAINTGNYYASLFLNADCVGGPHPVDPHSGQNSLSFQPKSVWVY
ncbi:peptidase inhibitor family I36 protein [Corallococcus terminator]|nr:peptidase inhibitor family I36 protein [Corallococcus terminator]